MPSSEFLVGRSVKPSPSNQAVFPFHSLVEAAAVAGTWEIAAAAKTASWSEQSIGLRVFFFRPSFCSLNFGWWTYIEDTEKEQEKSTLVIRQRRQLLCQVFPRTLHQILPDGPPKSKSPSNADFFEPFLHVTIQVAIKSHLFHSRKDMAGCSVLTKSTHLHGAPYIDRSWSSAWSAGNPTNLSRTRRHVNPLRVRWKKDSLQGEILQ